MATALEVPNIVIAPICDHCCSPWIATKEVIADELSTLSFVGLEITIRCRVHEIYKRALRIHCK